MKPLTERSEECAREGSSALAASSRMGAGKDDMDNICELLINVVSDDKPKTLTGLNQKGKGYG